MDTILLSLIGFLVVIILLFWICREIVNWYWKINERIVLQKETNSLLEKISRQLSANDKTSQQIVDKTFDLPIKSKVDRPIDLPIKNKQNENMKNLCRKWKLTNTVEYNIPTNPLFKNISFELKNDKTIEILKEYSSPYWSLVFFLCRYCSSFYDKDKLFL